MYYPFETWAVNLKHKIMMKNIIIIIGIFAFVCIGNLHCLAWPWCFYVDDTYSQANNLDILLIGSGTLKWPADPY